MQKDNFKKLQEMRAKELSKEQIKKAHMKAREAKEKTKTKQQQKTR